MSRARGARIPAWLALAVVSAQGRGYAEIGPPQGAVVSDQAVRRAMQDEIARGMGELRIGDEPAPYFIALAVTDVTSAAFSATFGALTGDVRWRQRALRVELRVGDPSLDNSNFAEGPRFSRGSALPIEDDHAALRREMWWSLDEAYKGAIETLAKKKASLQGQASADDAGTPDFAAAPKASFEGNRALLPPGDLEALREPARRLSAAFREHPDVQASRVDAVVLERRRRFLSSEGTWVDESAPSVQLTVTAETQAPDGMALRTFARFVARTSSGLPSLVDMEKEVHRVAAELERRRRAPVAENGSAVVLFEGPAAAQLVNLLVAPQLSGTPAPKTSVPDVDEGGSEWAGKLGRRVMSKSLSVVDDPSAALGAQRAPLLGGYRADDEGVAAEKVTLVDRGFLKTLLMTRTPRKEIARSNGHARVRGWGAPRALPSNLFVTAQGGLPNAALYARLAKRATEDGAEFFVVRLLEDGSAGGSGSGRSFRFMGGGESGPPPIEPIVVVRIKDGKEEPVRGLTFEGITPRTLKDVIAAGREAVSWSTSDPPGGFGLFTTITTPALALGDVDVKKDTGARRKPPIYPHPHFAK